MPDPTFCKELRELHLTTLDARLKQEIEACNGDITPLTEFILNAIADGSLYPACFDRYFEAARDPHVTAAGLRQTRSFFVRQRAIQQVSVALRSRGKFVQLWDALGGAHGVASIMRDLSVCHVNDLCKALSRATTNPSQQVERQQALSELLNLLCPLDVSSPESDPKTRDPRPLQHAYMYLVRSCTPELTRRWLRSKDWDEKTLRWCHLAHESAWRDQDLNETLSPPEGQVLRLNRLWRHLERDRKFTAHVLKLVVEFPDSTLRVDSRDITNSLILPLAKFMHRRSPPHEFRYQVWSQIDAAMVRFPKLVDCIPASLTFHAVRWWTWADADGDVARKSNIWILVNGILGRLLSSTNNNQCDLETLLRLAKFEDRLELLKLFFRHNKKYGFNLTFPCSAENLAVVASRKFNLPCRIFTMVPARGAIEFLNLLEEAQPAELSIQSSYEDGILRTGSAPGSRQVDPLMLRSLLLQRPGLEQSRLALLGEVEDEVHRRMTKSAKSRDPNDRLFWAQSALNLSIASGSLDLYYETLQWARRFKRDHHINPTIENHYRSPMQQALNLLSGTHISTPLAMVKDTIENGNKIALSSFEVAADAMEPTAPPPQSLWNSVTLAAKVARIRISQLNNFQARHSLSDDDVYDIVLQPTLTLLIQAEKLAIESVQTELQSSRMSGVLEFEFKSDETPKFSDLVWKFLDELGKARDQLWQRERTRRRPAVMTLSEPWCKGLPLQYIMPGFLVDSSRSSSSRYNWRRQGGDILKLPYLLAKAKRVVFMDTKHLLQPPPDDRETVLAIQGFVVDDFAMAVELLTHGQGGDKKKLSTEIWEHCVQHLTAGRLTDSEAVQFWRRWVFGGSECFDHLPKKRVVIMPKNQAREVGFPEWHPEDGPLAWDPSPVMASIQEDCKSKEDPPLKEEVEKGMRVLSIWHMLRASSFYPASTETSLGVGCRQVGSCQPYDVPVEEYEPPLIEDPAPRASTISRIAEEMLIINAHFGADTRFLMQPFPSSQDPCFPAVYLADEFLDGPHCAPSSCAYQLERNVEDVPAELLLQLASSVFKKLTAAGTEVTSHTTWVCMNLVELLGKSDRPWIACDFYKDIILTRPEDSSWHRHMFHPGFFHRLSPTQAKSFLLDIAHSIIGRMQAQAQHKLEEGNPIANPVPTVKVTVVKMLAQVMRGAKFVDEKTARDVLVDIIKNARHIDIRAAAVSVLVDSFINAPGDADTSTIINTLETEVVPVAACLNERWPMTEERWAEAEKTGEMPEVAPFNDTERPIFAQLAITTSVQLKRPQWRDKWQDTLVAKVIEKSKEINSRWMTLFLKVNSFSLAEGELLPTLPTNLAHMCEYLIHARSGVLALDTFNWIKQVSLEYLCNPPKSITASVRKDKKLLGSNAGKHWLYSWSDAGSKPPSNIVHEMAKILSIPNLPSSSETEDNPTTTCTGLTTSAHITDFFSTLSDIYIKEANHSELNCLILRLTTPCYENPFYPHNTATTQKQLNIKAWQINAIPLIHAVISRIDSTRSSTTWRRDPNRQPETLPDTFPMRMNVILSLYRHSILNLSEFAAEIKKLLCLQVLGETVAYHVRWIKVKDWILKDGNVSNKVFVDLAWELGDDLNHITGSYQPALEEYLRVELVLELLRVADLKDAKDGGKDATIRVDGTNVENVRELLKAWRESEDEVIRDGARSLLLGGKVEV
ncbi:hypothetical protein QBC43DRAFT_314362 [Cladorrhinum sp. PSN259]|nr:hypothetical protein QBC43DRAFT_314362 [Cladorrhinum sp. PSN259]